MSPSTVVLHRADSREAAEDRGRINMSWLVHLHWWAILGQVVVIVAVDTITEIGLPVTTLLTLLVLEVVGNFALGAWASRVRVTDAGIAAVMLLDVVMLTVLIDLTGGASNPFTTLYIVNVALAAVLLPLRWSWLLTAASLVGFGSLFVHESLVGPSHHVHIRLDSAEMMRAHVRGMWLSFALSAVFVVFFVQRISRALADRERELQKARALADRREKLASLATLAAGAAHELATPLGTIAIVAKELQRSVGAAASDEVRADLTLVREQVARCREILDRMSANAGEHAGEQFARFSSQEWVDAALEGLPLPQRSRIDSTVAGGGYLVGPPRALAEALRGLLKNALHASAPDSRVALRVSSERGVVRAAVRDRGRGIPPEVLKRIGEPFFTTKGPGEGMGLGLFITRALVEQLGGEFHIASRPGAGTEAWIDLPEADHEERSTS